MKWCTDGTTVLFFVLLYDLHVAFFIRLAATFLVSHFVSLLIGFYYCTLLWHIDEIETCNCKIAIATAVILNFGQRAVSVTWSRSGCQLHLPVKFEPISVDLGRIYCHFLQNPIWRPFAIFELLWRYLRPPTSRMFQRFARVKISFDYTMVSFEDRLLRNN